MDEYQSDMTDSMKMAKNKSHITKIILNLTLEIIYMLTGEEYTVVKKTSSECLIPSSRPCLSEGWNKTQSPMVESASDSVIHDKNNDQRILALTNKIVYLLTREVPIRCQDVTVYFSMEEWDYLEGHQDVYKDIMMETHQLLTSPGNRFF
ncbi:gastrula zinc finger protein XlCGF66.1-like [Bufo bufo]|uniref:gastrula zinc finger protein XlCGF66.1-like n=1 Tax=Bufo bufo TaxID=8384 RepID=UPI001ABEE805|nr:gastrula zinc finger protein XlCGF66.1-like [Bufo bufo]XP_040293846.1 gastrula zinc finger protein XlCGF66.1-like [Bufo bufo]XP_040293847.1 gastrula zinc finger protein XlCGF66.1-like [Bufo bufo]XP_040293848.1 gastrula zinc finger protein XlCGF66.1-like [Bufo bufo]